MSCDNLNVIRNYLQKLAFVLIRVMIFSPRVGGEHLSVQDDILHLHLRRPLLLSDPRHDGGVLADRMAALVLTHAGRTRRVRGQSSEQNQKEGKSIFILVCLNWSIQRLLIFLSFGRRRR